MFLHKKNNIFPPKCSTTMNDLFMLWLQVESNPTDEEEHLERLTCPVCLTIAVGPHRFHPCEHVFCVSCQQGLHRHNYLVRCALCRKLIRRETFCPGNHQGWMIINNCLICSLFLLLQGVPPPSLCWWVESGDGMLYFTNILQFICECPWRCKMKRDGGSWGWKQKNQKKYLL